MPKRPHANATTSPEMRAFIRESDVPTAVLARLLKVSESTVRKWRNRESIEDVSHKPKNLQTTLSPAQEYVIVELRKRLLLSLDELVVVGQEFINPEISRAGLQRCLKRHGVSRLSDMGDAGVAFDADASIQVSIENKMDHESLRPHVTPEAMKEVLDKALDADDTEVVSVNVTELPEFEGEKSQRRLLIANDPESRWVYVDIYEGDEKEAASRYMSHVLRKAPFHIRRILAGNYNEFLNRFRLVDESQLQANEMDQSNETVQS